MSKYILTYLIFVILPTKLIVAQDMLSLYLDIPYNATALPYEYIQAPEIKAKKVKSMTGTSIISRVLNFPNFLTEYTTYYDTNGIPLNKISKDTIKYYTAYHMNDDFLVDSTTYRLDSLGRLREMKQYFRTKYEKKYEYSYDINGRCFQISSFMNDTLRNVDLYKYDSLGRLIRKGNDSDYVSFTFEDDRIIEISNHQNKNNFIKFKYLYSNKENSGTEIQVKHKGDRVLGKIFYNADKTVSIRVSYYYVQYYPNKRNIVRKFKTLYEYDSNKNIIRSFKEEIIGNIISDTWSNEYRYNSKNLVTGHKMYNNWGQLENYIKYKYEYYK